MPVKETFNQSILPGFSENTGIGKIADNSWTGFAEKHNFKIRIRTIRRKTGFPTYRHGVPLWKIYRRSDVYTLGNPWELYIQQALRNYKTKGNR